MKKTAKIISFVIGMALIAALLVSSITKPALSADTTSALGKNLIIASADPDTSQTIPSDFKTEAANGKIWVDKSVSVAEDDQTLNITLSALGQEYIASIEDLTVEDTRSAADVLFILDFSSSMSDQSKVTTAGGGEITRFEAMIEAVNLAVKQIMSANPKNRIMICWYSKDQGTFLPLNSYNVNGKTDVDYFKYTTETVNKTTSYYISTVTGFRTASGDTTSYKTKRGNGTLSQKGIAASCEAFMAASKEKGLENVKRTPFVLFMTDGYTTKVDTDWYSASADMKQDDGISANGGDHSPDETSDQQVAALTILTAAWQKEKLTAHYNTLNGTTYGNIDDLKWYNVGLAVQGIAEKDKDNARALQVMLNPAYANGSLSTDKSARKVYDYIVQYASKCSHDDYIPAGKSTDKYLYTDSQCVTYAETGTIINQAFEALGEAVARLTGTTILPITKANIGDDQIFVTFTDVLGTGMELVKAGDAVKITLELNGKTYTGVSENGTCRFVGTDGSKLSSYAVITAEKVTWYIHASELPIIKFASRKNPGTAYDYDNDGVAEMYEDGTDTPIRVQYSVHAVESAVDSLTKDDLYLYSNLWNKNCDAETGTAYAEFTPAPSNSYYYNGTAQKTEAVLAKTENTTGTSVNNKTVTWEAAGEASEKTVYTIHLGNNGRISKIADITITPDVKEQYEGLPVEYTITVNNYTGSVIEAALIYADLQGVSILSSSLTPYTGTDNCWIAELPADEPLTITVKTTAGDSKADSYPEKASLYVGVTAVDSTELLVKPKYPAVVKTHLNDVLTDIDDILTDAKVTLKDSDGNVYEMERTKEGEYLSKEKLLPGTYKILADGKDTGESIEVKAEGPNEGNLYYYTVSYVTKYGKTPETETVLSGDKATDPGKLTDEKALYEFLGWYQEAEHKNTFDFTKPILKKTVVYAKWQLINIPVEYDKYVEDEPPVEDEIGVKNGSIIRVDPNGHGTYEDTKEITEFKATDEDGYVIDPAKADTGWIFAGYKVSYPEPGVTLFTAQYYEDKVGEEGKKPDGIPDIYQKHVIMKVVNGTWEDETEKDIDLYVTLLDKNGKPSVDGSAELVLPEGMVPKKGYTDSAAWDRTPENGIVSGPKEEIFTYTFDRVEYTYQGEEKKETDDISITKKLTVDPNGGTYNDLAEPTVYDPMKDPKTIPDSVPAEGCEFLYYTQEEDEDGNVTLTAVYKVPVIYISKNDTVPEETEVLVHQKRKLTVDPNGGKYEKTSEKTVYDPLESAKHITEPVPPLWKQFTGWKYEEDADGNVTLTAQYETVEIPVTGDILTMDTWGGILYLSALALISAMLISARRKRKA